MPPHSTHTPDRQLGPCPRITAGLVCVYFEYVCQGLGSGLHLGRLIGPLALEPDKMLIG